MDKKLWFKRKKYGWGWSPCSWQGWLVTLVYVALIILFILLLDINPTGRDIVYQFFMPLTLLTLIFLEIGHKKGEKPKWQWGKRRD